MQDFNDKFDPKNSNNIDNTSDKEPENQEFYYEEFDLEEENETTFDFMETNESQKSSCLGYSNDYKNSGENFYNNSIHKNSIYNNSSKFNNYENFSEQFSKYIENNLNNQQKLAIENKDGVFLVVAGAGSGKTRVITSRIANLIINKNVSPHEIVALTFTNKAANEMRERIKEFLPKNSPLPFLGTFHSYCLQLLKKNRDKIGKPFESILDEDDQIKILNGIITRSGLTKRVTAKKLAYSISQTKNSLTGDANQNAFEIFSSDRFLRDAFMAYEHEKTLSKCLDFDDLLIETVKLFGKNKEFKKTIQDHVRHVLVDEYQDTNITQHELLKHLTLNICKKDNLNKNPFENKFAADSLCVVGDEDQSIYSWRGATISNIINFKRDFPETQIIKLEQNYRSVQPILNAANEVIKNNKKRNPKNLWSEKNAANRIKTIQCSSEHQEGEIVSQYLKIAGNKQNLSSIAILYRAHYQSRSIEEALVKSCIPYKIIGGLQFYERKEIKDVLAHLRLIVNPFDRVSFFRVINCPTRGLGAKFEEQFYNLWNMHLFSSFKEIANIFISNTLEQNIPEKNIKAQNQFLNNEEFSLKGIKKESLQNFIKIFDDLQDSTLPSIAMEKIIARSQYRQYLQTSCEKEEYESRIDNLKELVRAAEFMERNGTKTISQFLDEVALMQESLMAAKDEESDQKDPVIMMTLHAAKGLEFDTIIIVGAEEGILPSSRSLFEDDALEEERRLFYVGLTRAKERLLLTHAEYRYAFGQTSYQPVSRFLREIPDSLKNEVDYSRTNPYKIDSDFHAWLEGKNYQSDHLMTFGPAKTENRANNLYPEFKQNNNYTENKFVNNKVFNNPSTKKGNWATFDNNKEYKDFYVKSSPKKLSPFADKSKNEFKIDNTQDTVENILLKNWGKNQPVSHPKFGIGIIQETEIKSDNKIYVTARFKSGIKKLDSAFLTRV